MSDTVIFHNPSCSKSRETLALLREHGIEPMVVEYLETPPSSDRLRDIAAKLGLRPRALVRTKEAAFAALSLDLDDDAAVTAALAAHPILLERPIVIRGDKAAIGRPPTAVLAIL